MPGPASFVILRDGRESTKKCSIAHLRGFEGIDIRTWTRGRPFDATGFLLLHPDGQPLTSSDAGRPILLVDCSWRHVNVLLCDLRGDFQLRSIPGGVQTAYPRRSKFFDDPASGLATIEALYIASAVTGSPRDDVMASYRHASTFLDVNSALLGSMRAEAMSHVPSAPGNP